MFWITKNIKCEDKRDDNGSVLAIILIIIALFAALSYAVTQSTRSGGGDASREKANLGASATLQYMTSVEMAVQRMMISNQCSVEQISFQNTISWWGANTNAPVNKTCDTFAPEGGAVIPKRLPAEYTDKAATNWHGGESTAGFYIMIVGVQNVGTSLPEIVMLYGAVNNDVCAEVNIKMGIRGRNDLAVQDNHGDQRMFTTDAQPLLPLPNPTGVLGDEDSRIAGHRTFCSEHQGLWGNYLYHVLIPR